MTIRQIERVDHYTFSNSYEKYVAARAPVIVTNLFHGQPIAEIKSLSDAKAAFGDVLLSVTREYSSAALSGVITAPQIMSFNEYWRLVEEDPNTTFVCTEYEIPAAIMSLFNLPDICLSPGNEGCEILGIPSRHGDHDLYSNLFLANRNNKAHLHYDGDHRQVLLYQVFGVKRVTLFPAINTYQLRPLDGPFFAGSGIYLEKLSEAERLDLIEAANGYCFDLQPGEAIYMPALIWHALEYSDDAMSFNIRCRRNMYGRFMSVDNFHRDNLVQILGYLLAGDLPDDSQMTVPEIMQELESEYIRHIPSIVERLRSMRALLADLCCRVCPEARIWEFYSDKTEDFEISRILKDLRGTNRYLPPAELQQTRPVGPATSIQCDQIIKKSVQLGHSDGLLRRLLFNRVGKSDIASLTRAEASIFLAYLRSPGAAITRS